MTIFAGFDTFAYPGDAKMKSLWDYTNLYWCGLYLGPRFNWSPHFLKIRTMGWGVAPIYTGKNPGSQKLLVIKNQHRGDADALQRALYANGALDGKEAVQQAQAAHVPTATILYFDVENTIVDTGWLEYYRGWSRAVVDAYYSVGLYTRAAHASWLTTALLNYPGFDVCLPTIWIAKYTRAHANGAAVPAHDYLEPPFPLPDPRGAGGGATSWQHLGNFGMKWPDSSAGVSKQMKFAPVDFDTSIFSDPGRGVLSTIAD